jgi:hypothetical protein
MSGTAVWGRRSAALAAGDSLAARFPALPCAGSILHLSAPSCTDGHPGLVGEGCSCAVPHMGFGSRSMQLLAAADQLLSVMLLPL